MLYLFLIANKHVFFFFFFLFIKKNKNNLLIGKSWEKTLANKLRLEYKETNLIIQNLFDTELLLGTF